MNKNIASAGQHVAMIITAILSTLDATFQGPDFEGRDGDLLAQETGCPGRVPVRDMRRALIAALGLLDQAIRAKDSVFGLPEIEKGPTTKIGVAAFARAAWAELSKLETGMIDFFHGQEWALPSLPFLSPGAARSDLESWLRDVGPFSPRKLDGRFMVSTFSGLRSMRADEILATGIGPNPDETASRLRALMAGPRPELEPEPLVPAVNAHFQAASTWTRPEPGTWKDALAPEPEPEPEPENVEGFWMVEHQDAVFPAEVAITYDEDPAVPVVLIPGVGTERSLEGVRLLWRIKVWTEAEMMVKAGQLMADHGLRPDSFRAFVADLVEMVGGVR